MTKLEFGNIYFIPKHLHQNKQIAGHFFVLLCTLEDKNEIIYQTLSSRVWRVFPKLNLLFGANSCINCGRDYFTREDYEHHNKYGSYLSPIDIDNIHFLNYNKYSFLNRETFISFGDRAGIVKDNFFEFWNKISDGSYPFYGHLADFNKKSLVLTLEGSSKIDDICKKEILDYYKETE